MKSLVLLSLVTCLESRTLFYLGVREEGFNAGAEVEQLQRQCGLLKGSAYCGCYLYVKRSYCGAEYPVNFAWAPSWGRVDKIVWKRGDPPDAIQDGMTVLLHNGERIFHVGDVFKKGQDGNGWYIHYDSGNTRSNNIISTEGIHLSKLYLRSVFAIADWITPKGEAPVKFHIVEPRQNLYRISLQYKTTVAELVRMNNLDSEMVRIGQKLRVE